MPQLLKTKGSDLHQPEPIFSGKGIRSISKNTVYITAGHGLNIAVRFFYAIVLASYLGPELYGLYKYGMSWYLSFISFTGLGLGVILSREIGRNRNNGEWFVERTLTIRILVALFVAVMCGVAGWFSEGEPETKRLLLIFSFALIGRSLTGWTMVVFTAYEANEYSFQQNAIFRPFEVLFGLLFLFAGSGILGLALVQAISWWLQALRGLHLVHRHMAKIRLSWAWSGVKTILSQGLVIGVGGIMMAWLGQGPLVLFRHTAGTENSLGQLALALHILFVLCNLPAAVSTAALPVMSRAVTREDGKDLLYAEVMLRVALIFGAAAGIAGIGAGPWLVSAVFGAKYGEAGRLVGMVLWLLVPWIWGNTIASVYVARGQYATPTVCAGAGAFALTLGMPWLASSSGISGAVLAIGLGMSVWAFSMIVLLARSGDLNVQLAIFRPLAAVALAICVYFLTAAVSVWLALVASFLALFGGAVVFRSITPAERSLLVNLTRWSSS